MSIFLQLVLVWLAVPNQEAAASPLRLERKLTEASLASELFGAGWHRSPGIIINDINKLDEAPAAQRDTIKELNLKPQLEADGVVGVADYTCVRTTLPVNTVTVRVFVFKDADQCDKFWHAKVLASNWEARLRTVEVPQYSAVDNIKTDFPNVQKRTIKFDNVYASAHQLGQDDLHLKALEHIIKQLTTRLEKSATEKQVPANSEKEGRK